MDNLNRHPLYREHNFDSAFSSLWEFYRKNFISLFSISLVMSLILQYASSFVDFRELQTITDPEAMLSKLKEFMIPILIITVFNLFMMTILQHYVMFRPVDKKNNILVALLESLKLFVPYMIIMVLLAFAGSVIIALGLMALVIGVFFSLIYIMTFYLFILPVMMAEGTNIAHVLARTIKLTHRNFWANLGWVASLLVIIVILSVILSGIILIPFTGSFLKSIVETQDKDTVFNLLSNPLFFILSAASNAIVFPLLPIFACIMYFNASAREEVILPESKNQEDNVRIEDLYAPPPDEKDNDSGKE
jgi:hypothetical protein